MSQATNVNSTSSISSRRSFLTKTAGLAAAGSTILALATMPTAATAGAPAKALDVPEASPALRDAVVALRESHDLLEAAKAKFTADDMKMAEWSELHPEPSPKNRRAQKKYWRRWRDVRGVTVDESWAAQLEAEEDFNACQMAVAKVKPLNENDLMLKAAVAFVYDKVKGAYGLNVAVISYSVAFDLFQMRKPAA
jgi:hypothetical protein